MMDGYNKLKAMKQDFGIILAIAILVTTLTRLIPGDWCGEYFTFRAASELLLSGQSPYRPELLAAREAALRNSEFVRLVPYYNPPWFALACGLLAPLAPSAGRIAWGFLCSLELVMSGWLLAGVAPGLSRPATVTLCVAFPLSLLVNWMGQLSPLVLLLAVMSWRLSEAGYDLAAGATLALMVFKPQLVVLLVPLLLLNSMRRGRRVVLVGFVVTVGILCLASFPLLPDWPYEFLWALRHLPLPTATRPEIGVTWWTVLRAAGLHGWTLVGAYATVALPVVALLVRSAWRAERLAFDLLAWGMLASFFLAPYAQIYDFPVLLPAVLLAIRRAHPVVALISILIVIPSLYIHLFAIVAWGAPPGSMFWLPIFLAIMLVFHNVRETAAPDTNTNPMNQEGSDAIRRGSIINLG